MCLWISYASQNKQHITLKITNLLVFVMQTEFVPARDAPRIHNMVTMPSYVPAVGNGKTNGRKPKRLMRGRALAFLPVMLDMWLKIWSWTSADRQTNRETACWKVTYWTTVIPSLEFFISVIFTGQTNPHNWMKTVYGEVRSKYFTLNQTSLFSVSGTFSTKSYHWK